MCLLNLKLNEKGVCNSGYSVFGGPDRETGEGGYCGDNDQWFVPMYAMRDTEVHRNDRICQFRIMEQQPEIVFEEVSQLTGADRGGFGTTGRN